MTNSPNNDNEKNTAGSEILSAALEELSAQDEDTAAASAEDNIPADSDTEDSDTAVDRPDEFAIPPRKKRRHSHDSSHISPSGTNTSASASDEADDFIFARYHGKKSHSYSYHSHSHSDETVVRSNTESHHRSKPHHHHRKHRDKKWKKRPWWQKLLIILGWIFSAILALILIMIITMATLNFVGLRQLTNYKDMDMSAPEMDGMTLSITDNGRYVNYNGQEYQFNEDITSILCIGVDKRELGTVNGAVGTAGQADALYLMALNTATGETSVISIPRDIITDIGIYSPEGEYLRTEEMQICLSYAYGDGKDTSCLNTTTAVSRLFYQLPINSHFAIDLSAIATLNDAVGGVSVTMIDDSFYDTDAIHHFKGETLTLYGEDARKYLQQRDVSELESTLDRLDRQVNYLKAFTSKALEMTKSDITTPVELYGIIKDNSVTNLTTAKMTAFATCLVSNGIEELDFKQVPGELTSDGTYAEYIVDEQALYEMILDVYYIKK